MYLFIYLFKLFKSNVFFKQAQGPLISHTYIGRISTVFVMLLRCRLLFTQHRIPIYYITQIIIVQTANQHPTPSFIL